MLPTPTDHPFHLIDFQGLIDVFNVPYSGNARFCKALSKKEDVSNRKVIKIKKRSYYIFEP